VADDLTSPAGREVRLRRIVITWFSTRIGSASRRSGNPREVVVDLSAAVWVKSTHSMSNGCVEVAFVDGQIAVRDSKNRDGAVLVFTPREWDAFISGVTDGQFQRPGWTALH
jgi:Domain of unknown function (DUF397)